MQLDDFGTPARRFCNLLTHFFAHSRHHFEHTFFRIPSSFYKTSTFHTLPDWAQHLQYPSSITFPLGFTVHFGNIRHPFLRLFENHIALPRTVCRFHLGALSPVSLRLHLVHQPNYGNFWHRRPSSFPSTIIDCDQVVFCFSTGFRFVLYYTCSMVHTAKDIFLGVWVCFEHYISISFHYYRTRGVMVS